MSRPTLQLPKVAGPWLPAPEYGIPNALYRRIEGSELRTAIISQSTVSEWCRWIVWSAPGPGGGMEIVAQDEAPTVEAAQRAADRELLARGWRLAPPEFVDPVQAIAAWDQLLRENP